MSFPEKSCDTASSLLRNICFEQPTNGHACSEPLRKYFYGLYGQAELNAFEANMYLAEDRVLCLEIVARKNSAF